MVKFCLSVFALVIASALSGCTGQTKEVETDAPSSPEGLQEALTVFDWTGHVVASEAELPTHYRPTEDLFWPVFQEGVLFSVDALPEAMEVALDWEGSGAFRIMLHSHKEHSANVYVQHITEMDYENPKCLRVPADDLATGAWQVMVHSERAMQTGFTLRIGLQGGAGKLIDDERHGHWLQDAEEVDPHESEPCQLLLDATANTTTPTSLPPATHFVFEESLACEGSLSATSAGLACIEFQAGPGGTGTGIDGHWIQLGEAYWGLVMTSTIDQGGVQNDSDCLFTNADGVIIETPDIDAEPCAGVVPEGARWVFVYPYLVGALGMTVDFALPPAV